MKATLPTTQTVVTEPDRANLIPWGPPEDEFEEDFLVTEHGKTKLIKSCQTRLFLRL